MPGMQRACDSGAYRCDKWEVALLVQVSIVVIGGCTVSAGATEIREGNCACEYSCLLRTQGAVAYVSTDACREQR